MLIDILQRRRVDQRREEIAAAAKASIADFHAGKLQPQPLDAIVQELKIAVGFGLRLRSARE